jgi:hypothetical protein
MTESMSLARRLAVAFLAFFRIVGRRELALGVDRLMRGTLDVTPALHLLKLLQREGRFVDFLQDDVASHPDAKVGAVARAVHGGCRKALADYLRVEPVLHEPEGSTVKIEPGFDPAQISLTGNVVGDPPFSGTLTHHGWQAAEFRLPDLPRTQDVRILARAEVEI